MFLPLASVVDKFISPFMGKLMGWSDPMTVICTLAIVLGPVLLAYVCAVRIGMVKVT